MIRDDRWLSKYAVWLLMGLVTVCALAGGAALFLIPPRLESHQDQIVYVLNQHGIAFNEVRLSQTSRDTQYYFAYAGYSIYGADVTIQLANTRKVLGRIECQKRDSGCKLYLTALGFANEPLPELATGPHWLWLDWLQEKLSKLGLR